MKANGWNQALTPRRRFGMSTIELLVVLFVVAGLMGLLLPAIQQARHAAQRFQCSVQLVRLALAFQVHADRHQQMLLHGGADAEQRLDNLRRRTAVPRDAAGRPYWNHDLRHPSRLANLGWSFHILPYVEQHNVYSARGSQMYRARVPQWVCPSAPRSATGAVHSPSFDDIPGWELDYAASAGSRDIRTAGMHDGAVVRNGLQLVTLGDLSDGRSHVVLLGDKYKFAGLRAHPQPGNSELGGFSGWDRGCVPDAVRSSFDAGNPQRGWRQALRSNQDDYRQFNHGRSFQGFGSSHAGGVNIATADGAVHFVTWGIDPRTFRNLTIRDDGSSTRMP